MRRIVAVAVVVLSGCEGRVHIETKEPYPWDRRIGQQEKVRIVAIEEHPDAFMGPRSTVVEFPDGTRRRKVGKWGDVGDEFTAYKAAHDIYWINDDPIDSAN